MLEQCYSDYASQRKSVQAVCSALTNGWEAFCDELVTSNESFVNVCKSMKKADVWVETEAGNKRSNVTEGGEVKRLKTEVAKLQSRLNNNNNNSYRNQNNANNANGGGAGLNGGKALVPSKKPCFDFFAGKPCQRNPCPFRHDGDPPAYNPAKQSK